MGTKTEERNWDILASRGEASKDAIQRLREVLGGGGSDADEINTCVALIAGVADDWPDDHVGVVLAAVADKAQAGQVSASDLGCWLQAHGSPEERRNLLDCITVVPPAQVTIRSVLSRAGSQKVVYRALWHISSQDVVLKRFIGEGAEGVKVMLRELQIHPLSMEHPNINVTHLLSNSLGEEFLVERYIEVLDDEWRAQGAAEASSLLHDIASALDFVHGRGLVHGDVKPDNIGYENRRYLLCDFGICRPASEFEKVDATPTGSLRTRAPELLQEESKHSPAADVWALGATVFNGLVGRFPLYGAGEAPPRPSSAEERAAFEAELAERAARHWDDLVGNGLDEITPLRLRRLLEAALAIDPRDRPSADVLARCCRHQLAPLVRASGRMPGLAPDVRVAQLGAYLGSDADLALMPQRVRSEMLAEVSRLRSTPRLPAEQSERLARIAERFET